MRFLKKLGMGGLLIVLGAGLHAAPTTLELVNGEVIVGTVTRREGGRIYITAELLGNLVINEADVVSTSAVPPTPPASIVSSNVTQGGPRGSQKGGKRQGESVNVNAPFSGRQVVNQAAPAQEAAPEAPAPAVQHAVASASIPGRPDGSEKKVFWSSELTVGGSYTSAPYNQGVVPGTIPGITGAKLGAVGVQKTAQASGSIVRATATDAESLEGSYTYADYQPSPTAVVDNYSTAFAWNHALTPLDYTVSRTIYEVDRVRDIYHSFAEIVGVGHKWLNTPTDKLDFVPGLVLSNERKNFVFDDKWETGYGFLESYTHNFNPYVSLEERVLARTIFNDESFYAYDAYVGFTGMLSKTLGIKVGFTYNFDNSAPDRAYYVPGVNAVFYPSNKGVLTFTTGFQYKFSTPP